PENPNKHAFSMPILVGKTPTKTLPEPRMAEALFAFIFPEGGCQSVETKSGGAVRKSCKIVVARGCFLANIRAPFPLFGIRGTTKPQGK
ncbi:MAG TPA: hypothetical protein VK850_18800, partial [Candidatus Binatia bacterium]|nr:hypothetical protein [Candidatus Binatia bacterium]